MLPENEAMKYTPPEKIFLSPFAEANSSATFAVRFRKNVAKTDGFGLLSLKEQQVIDKKMNNVH